MSVVGLVVGTIDVAQILLVLFIGFVFAVFLYLHREDKREGYPLIDPAGGKNLVGWPLPPPPKRLLTAHSGTEWMPHPPGRPDVFDPASPLLRPGAHPGAAFVATGDPLVDGVGAASWASKRDEPIWTWEGEPQLRPLRLLPEWTVDETDGDPRGWPVRDRAGRQVGVVVDLWLDGGVKILRYLEVALNLPGGPPRAMVPLYFAETYPRMPEICVPALSARQFMRFPQLQKADTITAREEDQVSAYCQGGLLYKDDGRGA